MVKITPATAAKLRRLAIGAALAGATGSLSYLGPEIVAEFGVSMITTSIATGIGTLVAYLMDSKKPSK